MTNKIIIYSTETCTHCKIAKSYLSENGFEYTEIDVHQHPEYAKMIIEKTGQRSVPVIDIDGKLIVGFDVDIINQVLNITE